MNIDSKHKLDNDYSDLIILSESKFSKKDWIKRQLYNFNLGNVIILILSIIIISEVSNTLSQVREKDNSLQVRFNSLSDEIIFKTNSLQKLLNETINATSLLNDIKINLFQTRILLDEFNKNLSVAKEDLALIQLMTISNITETRDFSVSIINSVKDDLILLNESITTGVSTYLYETSVFMFDSFNIRNITESGFINYNVLNFTTVIKSQNNRTALEDSETILLKSTGKYLVELDSKISCLNGSLCNNIIWSVNQGNIQTAECFQIGQGYGSFPFNGFLIPCSKGIYSFYSNGNERLKFLLFRQDGSKLISVVLSVNYLGPWY